eukprot:12364-Prorocentrum_minimum.AAC.2
MAEYPSGSPPPAAPAVGCRCRPAPAVGSIIEHAQLIKWNNVATVVCVIFPVVTPAPCGSTGWSGRGPPCQLSPPPAPPARRHPRGQRASRAGHAAASKGPATRGRFAGPVPHCGAAHTLQHQAVRI